VYVDTERSASEENQFSLTFFPKGKNLTAVSTVKCLSALVELVEFLSKMSATGKSPAIVSWDIERITMNSPMQVTLTPARNSNPALISSGMVRAKRLFTQVEATGNIPDEFRKPKILNLCKSVGRHVNEDGISSVSLKSMDGHWTVPQRLLTACEEAERPVITTGPVKESIRRVSCQSVVGRIQQLVDSEHTRSCILIAENDGAILSCDFDYMELEPKQFWYPFATRRYRVFGEVELLDEVPELIRVISLSELPPLDARAFELLRGIDPTGGESAANHIADVRSNG
jgi:hypothetical protein